MTAPKVRKDDGHWHQLVSDAVDEFAENAYEKGRMLAELHGSAAYATALDQYQHHASDRVVTELLRGELAHMDVLS